MRHRGKPMAIAQQIMLEHDFAGQIRVGFEIGFELVHGPRVFD